MIVANDSDGTTTATNLGIAVNGAVTSVNSGDMHLRVVSMNTQLADLNGGGGVAAGTVTLTDSTGKTATLTVDSSMQTVGDVVNAINRLGVRAGLGISAGLNTTGDGILLTDSAGGSGTIGSRGDSTTAADLNLLGHHGHAGPPSTAQRRKPSPWPQRFPPDLGSEINNLNAGVTASIINDGSSNPYRLLLTSTNRERPARWSSIPRGWAPPCR